MSKVTLEYTPKHHILEVDGTDYGVPHRTAALMKKLAEHDRKLGSVSEYDSNMDLIETLFGKKAAGQMFPDGENTDLDKLAKCSRLAVALFMSELNIIRSEDLPEEIK